jgi:hypothetical protein
VRRFLTSYALSCVLGFKFFRVRNSLRNFFYPYYKVHVMNFGFDSNCSFWNQYVCGQESFFPYLKQYDFLPFTVTFYSSSPCKNTGSFRFEENESSAEAQYRHIWRRYSRECNLRKDRVFLKKHKNVLAFSSSVHFDWQLENKKM